MLQLSDFRTACPNALSAALAHEVYKDLWKDDKPNNLKPLYDDELKDLLISAEEDKKIYLPVLYTKDIDFKLIQKLQKKLSRSSIFLAIVDNTGNILYYEIRQEEFDDQPSTSASTSKRKLPPD
ncbi:uncharacterized protein Dwil_GK27132 [Drosophila willistoni]|uniref:tRNA-splicing endonuclease subunit Sen15 domain-containing protein n=1 Tax=Drosophila willistoni TaxID=7260 RepID=A0A0Q9X0Y1_DROWI|nr:uncharacterized protein LOC26529134 [Drosophila willistoni]KRF99155.1 uncharacterized protein Dwil_GK27132 [Drosophila willistoni]